MAQTAGIQSGTPLVPPTAPTPPSRGAPYDAGAVSRSDVVVYRLTGAFFFGTASMVSAVLDSIGDQHKAFVLDFAAVPFVDSTAANVIASLARARHGTGEALSHRSEPGRPARSAVAGVRPPLGDSIARASTMRCRRRSRISIGRMKLLLSDFALRTWGDRIQAAMTADLTFVTAEEALAATAPATPTSPS